MTEKYFKFPFADQGDREAVPDDQVNTLVNYQFGYTPGYELNPDTDPDGNYIGRQRFNQVLYDMTAHAKQIQDDGYTLYFADVSYKKGRIVSDGSGNYYRAKQDVTGVAPPSAEWDGPLDLLQPAKATAAQAQAGTDDEAYLTSLKGTQLVAQLFSEVVIDSGSNYYVFPKDNSGKSLIVQWGEVAIPNGSMQTVTFNHPISFPNKSLFALAQVVDVGSVYDDFANAQTSSAGSTQVQGSIGNGAGADARVFVWGY